jgi:hypothetical protein
MAPRIVLTVIGLQRTGNHAVIDWIGALFPRHAFHNNNPHDLFADPDRLAALLAAHDEDCVIFSFEDSPGRMADVTRPVLESVTPFPAARFPGIDSRTLLILRDPYNLWASRTAARRGNGLTSDPSWDLFRRNWLDFAARQQADPAGTILFNRWNRDADYRRQICAGLGGRYSETTLDQVPEAGGGSSFDGLPRPTLGRMLGNWRHYLSAAFLGRLVSRPGHYLRRLMQPPATGRRLKVDDRWRSLTEDPAAAALFADAALRAETARIFGPEALPLAVMPPPVTPPAP